MARNLFILSALALLAGCSSPELPPSSSGFETASIAPVATPATPVAPAPAGKADAAPTAVPAKKKLPLGTVRHK